MKTIRSSGMPVFLSATVRLLKLVCKEKAVFSYLEASQLLRVSPEFPDPSILIKSISIDTRTLKAGELFVAFKGENGDGHDYVEAAFQKGASGALFDKRNTEDLIRAIRSSNTPIRNLIPVEDPQKAMTQLAVSYRTSLSVKTIGITGSVGKTTTKEFLAFLLRQSHPTLSTFGNLNNHLGVPIMLSRLLPEHRYCVMELGASHPGEIAYLSDLIKPSAAILTPIGPAHLAGFGSLENVYDTKLEIVDFLDQKAPLITSDQDLYLQEKIRQKKKSFTLVGFSPKAEYHISDVNLRRKQVSFKLNGRGPFVFPGNAPFLALNAALALAMVRSLSIPWEVLPEDWSAVTFPSGRFHETILPNGVRIIDDCYNANPISFGNALKAFQALECEGRKILVFADMLELGKEEDHYHYELGQAIMAAQIPYALAYGEKTQFSIDAIQQAKANCSAVYFQNPKQLTVSLLEILRPGDAVLFKGSRSMHVEKVLMAVQEAFLQNTADQKKR